MSLEMLEQLEAKVQMAVDTISLLQMEVEELKEKNENLANLAQELRADRESLVQDNEKLRHDHQAWQERVRALLGKMDTVE
ncbi:MULTISPECIES: cell division protein ZapB [Photobacterium]|uniref:Cell division protein ZapB n=1 Tax=Photobacterium galatheae TaxID=1654360 RepID=A0A066RTC3_9GAMM|nr:MULTISPECIES: cell division protein ZapB [Photobacterium]KDM90628.1 septal ring assembly protein ZapB [Photobacterium galatheae]MCM0150677.1 cell division protein ZapB [Photobacterium galatheae]MDO6706255.1 cell division protein ZapB [Photobacterium sp. 1_MG-2023]QUJ67260.1 cell division protein ZapB [Photobacterium sp. GJ3]UTM57529.1 cell division protein ZapB [Photobacterium sp. CCB-ST2H9]